MGETKLSRRVLILRLSVVLILQGYTCPPNMRGGQTQEHTEKERSCTREELRFSGQNGWSPCGKTRTQNGPREQRPDFQSGSEKDPAKRPEIQRLLRERKVALKMLLKKRNMTRRRNMTRKRRSKLKLHKSENIPYILLLPLMKVK